MLILALLMDFQIAWSISNSDINNIFYIYAKAEILKVWLFVPPATASYSKK